MARLSNTQEKLLIRRCWARGNHIHHVRGLWPQQPPAPRGCPVPCRTKADCVKPRSARTVEGLRRADLALDALEPNVTALIGVGWGQRGPGASGRKRTFRERVLSTGTSKPPLRCCHQQHATSLQGVLEVQQCLRSGMKWRKTRRSHAKTRTTVTLSTSVPPSVSMSR